MPERPVGCASGGRVICGSRVVHPADSGMFEQHSAGEGKRTPKRVSQVSQRRGILKTSTTRRTGQTVRHVRNGPILRRIIRPLVRTQQVNVAFDSACGPSSVVSVSLWLDVLRRVVFFVLVQVFAARRTYSPSQIVGRSTANRQSGPARCQDPSRRALAERLPSRQPQSGR